MKRLTVFLILVSIVLSSCQGETTPAEALTIQTDGLPFGDWGVLRITIVPEDTISADLVVSILPTNAGAIETSRFQLNLVADTPQEVVTRAKVIQLGISQVTAMLVTKDGKRNFSQLTVNMTEAGGTSYPEGTIIPVTPSVLQTTEVSPLP